MTYTEDQIRLKNKIYNDAEDVLKRMLNVIDKVRNGEFEAAACRQEGIDNLRFRSFIRSNWVCDDTKKKKEYDAIPYSWREKFIKDVYGNIDISVKNFDAAFEYILLTLTEKEKLIIKMRYMDELTLEEIGKKVNLSRERVRQILARTKRRLNVKNRKLVFEKGVDYVESLQELREAEKNYNNKVNEIRKMQARTQELNNRLKDGLAEDDIKTIINSPIKIEDIDMSARAKNCLKRGGIIYLNDLTGYGRNDFIKIPNLGEKSLAEIKNICVEYGVILKN